MGKRRFECTVERYDRYIIEIDEGITSGEYTLEEHAEYIAQNRARFSENFIEGYGTPLVDGVVPFFTDKNSVEKGINIIIVSEDDDCEVEVIELEDEIC